MNSFLNPDLLDPGDRILLGVSGGADSLSLLHDSAALRDELWLELVSVHVYHGMRGTAAVSDVEFLPGLCAAWDVPLEVSRQDGPARVQEGRVSVEQAGGEARYA